VKKLEGESQKEGRENVVVRERERERERGRDQGLLEMQRQWQCEGWWQGGSCLRTNGDLAFARGWKLWTKSAISKLRWPKSVVLEAWGTKNTF